MLVFAGPLSDLTVIFISLSAVLLFGATIYALYFIIPILLAKLIQAVANVYFRLYTKGYRKARVHVSYFRLGLFMRRIHLQSVYFSTAEYTIFVGDVHLHFSLLRRSGFLSKVLQEHVIKSQTKDAHSLTFPLFPAVVHVTGIDIHLYSRKPLPYTPTEEGLRRYMEEYQSKLANAAAQRKLPFFFRVFGPVNLDIRGIRLVLSNPYLRCGVRATIGSANGVLGVHQEAELFTFYTSYLDLKLHSFNVNFIENEFYNPIFDYKRQNFFEKKSCLPLYSGKNSLSVSILSSPVSRLTVTTTSDLSKVSFRPGLHSSQDRSEIYDKSFPEGIVSIRLIDPKITYSPWLERERRRVFLSFFPETFLPRQVWPLPSNEELFFRPTLNYKISVIFDTPGTIQYWYRNTDQPYDPVKHDIILAWKRAQMESARVSQQLHEFKANSTISCDNNTYTAQSIVGDSVINQGTVPTGGATSMDDGDCTECSTAYSMCPITTSPINSPVEEAHALLSGNYSASVAQLQPAHSRKGSNLSSHVRMTSSTTSKVVLDSIAGLSKRLRTNIQGSPLIGSAVDDFEALAHRNNQFQSVANLQTAVFNDDLFAQFNVDSSTLQIDNFEEPTCNPQSSKDEDQAPEAQTLRRPRTLWSNVFGNTIPFVNRFIRSSTSKGEQEFNIFDSSAGDKDATSAAPPPTVGAYTSPHEGISFTCSTGTVILLKMPVFSYFPTRTKKISAFIPHVSAKTTVIGQEFFVAENISFVWDELTTGTEYSAPTKWNVGFFAENLRAELTGAIISQITHLLGDLTEDDKDLLSYYRKSLIPLIDNNTVILAHEFPIRDRAYNVYCNAPPNRLQTMREVQYSKIKRFIPVEMDFTIRVVNYEIGVATAVDNVCSSLHHLSAVQPVQDFLIHKYSVAYHRLYCQHKMLAEHDFKELRLVSAHHYVYHNNPFLNMFWRLPLVIGASNRSIYCLLDLTIDVINNDYEQVANMLHKGDSISKDVRPNLVWLNTPYNVAASSTTRKRRCTCLRSRKKGLRTLPPVSRITQETDNLLPLKEGYTHSRYQSTHGYEILESNTKSGKKGSKSYDDVSLVPASVHSGTKLSSLHVLQLPHTASWDTLGTSSTSLQQTPYPCTVDEFLKVFLYESPDAIDHCDHRIELLRIANGKKHANSNPLTYEEYLSLLTYSPPTHSRLLFAGVDLSCGIAVPRLHNLNACIDGGADAKEQLYTVLDVKLILKMASIYVACTSTSRQSTFLKRLYSAKKTTNKSLTSPFASGPLPRTELRIGMTQDLVLDAHLDTRVANFLKESVQAPPSQIIDSSVSPSLSYPQDNNLSLQINVVRPELLVSGSVIAIFMHFLENLFLAQRFPISDADYIIMPFNLHFKNQLARAYESYYLYHRLKASYANDLWLDSIKRAVKDSPEVDLVERLTDRDILIRLSHEFVLSDQMTYSDVIYPVSRAATLYQRFSHYLTSMRLFLTIYADRPIVSVTVHEFSELPRRFSFAYSDLNTDYNRLFTTSLSDPRGLITFHTQKLTFAIVSSRSVTTLSVSTTPLRGGYLSHAHSTITTGGFDMHVTMPKTQDSIYPLPTRTAYSMTLSALKLSAYPEFVGVLTMLIRNFCVTFLAPSFNHLPASFVDHSAVGGDHESAADVDHGKVYDRIRQMIAERMQKDLELLTNKSNFLLLCNYLEDLNDSDHTAVLHRLYTRGPSATQARLDQDSFLLDTRTDSSGNPTQNNKTTNRPDLTCSTISSSSLPLDSVMYARCPDRLRYLLFYNGSNWRLTATQVVSFDISIGQFDCSLIHTFSSNSACSTPTSLVASVISKRGVACYINNHALKDNTRLLLRCTVPDIILRLRDPFSQSTSVALKTAVNIVVHQTGDNAVGKAVQLLYYEHHKHLLSTLLSGPRAQTSVTSIPTIVVSHGNELTCTNRPKLISGSQEGVLPVFKSTTNYCHHAPACTATEFTRPGSLKASPAEQYPLPAELEDLLRKEKGDNALNDTVLRRAMYLQFVAPGTTHSQKRFSRQRTSVKTASASSITLYSTETDTYNEGGPDLAQGSTRLSRTMIATNVTDDFSLYSTETTVPSVQGKADSTDQASYDETSDSILLPDESPSRAFVNKTKESLWQRQAQKTDNTEPSCPPPVSVDKFAGIEEEPFPFLIPAHLFHSILDHRMVAVYTSAFSSLSQDSHAPSGLTLRPKSGPYMSVDRGPHQSKPVYNPTNLPVDMHIPTSGPAAVSVSITVEGLRTYIKPEGIYGALLLVSQILSPDFTVVANAYTFLTAESNKCMLDVKNIYLCETMLRTCYYAHLKQFIAEQKPSRFQYISNLMYSQGQLDLSQTGKKDGQEMKSNLTPPEHKQDRKDKEDNLDRICAFITLIASQSQLLSSLSMSHFGRATHHQLETTLMQMDGTATHWYLLFAPQVEQYKLTSKEMITLEVFLKDAEVVALADGFRSSVTLRMNQLSSAFALSNKIYSFNNRAYKMFCRLSDRFCPQTNMNKFRIQTGALLSLKANNLTLETIGGVLCTIKGVSLKLNCGIFFSQGNRATSTGSRSSSLYLNTKKNPMKIDVATMRTDRSARIDTDSAQTAQRLYSHTSTEATETTDKSATSQKGMDAFLKMLLNTLCVEANAVTLNIPIMLLQPLDILLAHYVGSFQRGMEAIVLSTVIAQLSKYMLLRTFVPQRHLVWHALKPTSDVTESKSNLASNLYPEQSNAHLNSLLVILSQRDTNASFEAISKSIFSSFCKDLSKDPLVSLGSRVIRWMKRADCRHRDAEGGSQSLGSKLEFSIQSICQSQKSSLPVYKIKIDAGLKLSPLRSDAILFLALSLKEYSDTLSFSKDSVPKQMIFWQSPHFEAFRVPKEPVMLYLNYMTRHLLFNFWGAKAQAALANLQQGAGESVTVKHMVQLSLSLHDEFAVQATSSTHLPFLTASASSPPCFKASVLKPKLQLSINERLSVTLAYKSLNASFSLPLFLLANVCRLNSAFYAYNTDRVMDTHREYTYQQPPSLLISNIAVNLFSINGIYRILSNKDARQTLSVPTTSPSVKSAPVPAHPVLSHPYLAELRAFQEYEHTKVVSQDTDSPATLSAYDELSITATEASTHSSGGTLVSIEPSADNEVPKDDVCADQLRDQATLALNKDYPSFDNQFFAKSFTSIQPGEIDANEFDTLSDTLLLTREPKLFLAPLFGKDALHAIHYAKQNTNSIYSNAEIAANLIQSRPVSLDEVNSLRSKCNMKGQISIRKWLLHIAKFSHISAELVFPDTTIDYAHAATGVPIVVASFPSTRLTMDAIPPLLDVFAHPFSHITFLTETVSLGLYSKVHSVQAQNPLSFNMDDAKREYLIATKSFDVNYTQSVVRFVSTPGPNKADSPIHMLLAHSVEIVARSLEMQLFTAHNRLFSLLHDVLIEARLYTGFAETYSLVLSAWTDHAFYLFHEYTPQSFWDCFCCELHFLRDQKAAASAATVVVDAEIPFVSNSRSAELQIIQRRQPKRARPSPFSAGRSLKRQNSYRQNQDRAASSSNSHETPKDGISRQKDPLLNTLSNLSGNHVVFFLAEIDEFMLGIDSPRLVQCSAKLSKLTVSLSLPGHQTEPLQKLRTMTNKEVFSKIYCKTPNSSKIQVDSLPILTITPNSANLGRVKHSLYEDDDNSMVANGSSGVQKKEEDDLQLISSIASLLLTNRKDLALALTSTSLHIILHSSYVNQDTIHAINLPTISSTLLFKDLSVLTVQLFVSSSQNSFSGELFILLISLLRKLISDFEQVLSTTRSLADAEMCQLLRASGAGDKLSPSLLSTFDGSLTNVSGFEDRSLQAPHKAPLVHHCLIEIVVSLTTLSITSTSHVSVFLLKEITFKMNYESQHGKKPVPFDKFDKRGSTFGEFELTFDDITLYTHVSKSPDELYLEYHPEYLIFKTKDVEGLTKVLNSSSQASTRVIQNISSHISMSFQFTGQISSKTASRLTLTVQTLGLLIHPLLYSHIVSLINDVQVWRESYALIQSDYIPKMSKNSSLSSATFVDRVPSTTVEGCPSSLQQGSAVREPSKYIQFTIEFKDIDISIYSDCGLEFVLADSKVTLKGTCVRETLEMIVVELAIDELIGNIQLFIVPPYVASPPCDKHRDTEGDPWSLDAVLGFLTSITAIPTGNVFDFCLSLKLIFQTGIPEASIMKKFQCNYPKLPLESATSQPAFNSNELCNTIQLDLVVERFVLALNETAVPLLADFFFTSIRYISGTYSSTADQSSTDAIKVTAILLDETIQALLERVEVMRQKTLYMNIKLSVLRLGLEVYEFSDLKETIRQTCEEYTSIQPSASTSGTRVGATFKADGSSVEVGAALMIDAPSISFQTQVAKRTVGNPFTYSSSQYGQYGSATGGSITNLHGKSITSKEIFPPVLSIILPQLNFDFEAFRVPKNDLSLYKNFDVLRPFITSDLLKMNENTKLYIKPATISFMAINATLYRRTLFFPPEVFRVLANFISKWLQVIEKYSLKTFSDHQTKKSSYSLSSDGDGEIGTGTGPVSKADQSASMSQTQVPQASCPRDQQKTSRAGKSKHRSMTSHTPKQSQGSLVSDLAGLYEILQAGASRSSTSKLNFLTNIVPDTFHAVVALEIEQQTFILDSVARPIIENMASSILGDAYNATTPRAVRHSRESSKLDYAAVSPSNTNTPDNRYTKSTVFSSMAQEDLQPGYDVLSFVSVTILPIKLELLGENEVGTRTIEASLTFLGLNARVIPYAIQFIAALYKASTAGTVDHAHPVVFSIKNVLMNITSTVSMGENQVSYNNVQNVKINMESISLELALHSFEHMSAVSAIWIHNTEKLRGMVAFRDIMHATSKKWPQDDATKVDGPAEKSILGKYLLDLSITCQNLHLTVNDLSYYKLNPISSVFLAQNRAIRNRQMTEKDALLTHEDIVGMILGHSDTAEPRADRDIDRTGHRRGRSILSSENSAEACTGLRNESTDTGIAGAVGNKLSSGQESYEEHPLHHVTQMNLEFGEVNTGCKTQLTDQQLELILQITALEKQQKMRVPVLVMEFSKDDTAVICNIRKKAAKLQATVSIKSLLLKYGHTIACKLVLHGVRLSIKNFSYSVTNVSTSDSDNYKDQDVHSAITVPNMHSEVTDHSSSVLPVLLSNEQVMVAIDAALHLDQLIVHVFEEVELAYMNTSGCFVNLSACHTISEKILRNQSQYKKNKTSIGLGVKSVNAYIGMQVATAIYGSLQRVLSDTTKLWKEGKVIVQNHHTALSVDNILLKLKRYISKGERDKERIRRQKKLAKSDELYFQAVLSTNPSHSMSTSYTLDAKYLKYFSKTARVKLSLQIDTISLRLFQGTLLDNYHCAIVVSKLDLVLSLLYNPVDHSTKTIPLKLQITKKALLEKLGHELVTKDKQKTQAEATDTSSTGSNYPPPTAHPRESGRRSRTHINNAWMMAFSLDDLQLTDTLPVVPTTSIALSIAFFTLSYGERLGQGASKIAINPIMFDESVNAEKVKQGLGYIHKGQYHDYIHVLVTRNELLTIMSCTEVLKLGRSSWDINYSTVCSVLKLPENSGPLYMLQMLSGLAKPNLSNLTAGSQFIAAVGTINSILSDILAFKRSVSKAPLLDVNRGDARDIGAMGSSMSASKEAFLHSSVEFSPDTLSRLPAEQSVESKEATKTMAANMMRIYESEKLWLLSQMNVESADALVPNLGLLGKGGSDLLGSIIGSTLKSNRYLNKVFTGVTAGLYHTGEEVTNLLISQAKQVFYTRAQNLQKIIIKDQTQKE